MYCAFHHVRYVEEDYPDLRCPVCSLTAELADAEKRATGAGYLRFLSMSDEMGKLEKENAALWELARLYSDGNQYDAHQLSVKLGIDAAKEE